MHCTWLTCLFLAAFWYYSTITPTLCVAWIDLFYKAPRDYKWKCVLHSCAAHMFRWKLRGPLDVICVQGFIQGLLAQLHGKRHHPCGFHLLPCWWSDLSFLSSRHPFSAGKGVTGHTRKQQHCITPSTSAHFTPLGSCQQGGKFWFQVQICENFNTGKRGLKYGRKMLGHRHNWWNRGIVNYFGVLFDIFFSYSTSNIHVKIWGGGGEHSHPTGFRCFGSNLPAGRYDIHIHVFYYHNELSAENS